jgi:two-component system heavy metal sensor histidine kinase CusS
VSSTGAGAAGTPAAGVQESAATPCCLEGGGLLSPCSHAIGDRLSRRLALFTMIVLAFLSTACWWSVALMLKENNARDLSVRQELLAGLLTAEARMGGVDAVTARLHNDAPLRGNARIELVRRDGRVAFADPPWPADSDADHRRTLAFTVPVADMPGGVLEARYTADFTHKAAMGRRWAWILTFVTLAAGVVVAFGAQWQVRHALRPLRQLAAQTRAISPQHLDQRLALPDPAEELHPMIEQFNALMGRLERSYAQLEAFNADVAHELRTPLANLIGETEVALSRERSNEALRDTLASNLEEMQRLSAMVNDMLFLASADRGAVARRGAPVSLAALARQVVEFHEAPLEDAALSLRIEGDAVLPVDEPLVKRALSNLLGNATRFAEHGSTVIVRISGALAPVAGPAPQPVPGQVQVVVQNQGPGIPPQQLPRLFDRFFRGDDSRCCPSEQHHGLGLAIVAAIARMHAGRTLAESDAGTTRVGFTLAAG